MIGQWLSCKTPRNLGIRNGNQLKKVPRTPNCVSSQADSTDKMHYMEAWTFVNLSEAKDKIRSCIMEFGNTSIKVDSGNYIHVVFTSGWMQYYDDVEFFFDSKSHLIHFRSGSRVGIGDNGVNRKRMTKLKEMYLSE